jgi:hypothetical protein
MLSIMTISTMGLFETLKLITLNIKVSIVIMLNVIILSVVFFVVMMSVIMLCVVVLSVVMLNIIMLGGTAPAKQFNL